MISQKATYQSILVARFEKLAELGADEYVPEGQGGQLGSHESDPFHDGETLVYQQAGPAPVAAVAAGGFQIFEADIAKNADILECRDDFEVPEKGETETPSPDEVEANKAKWGFTG